MTDLLKDCYFNGFCKGRKNFVPTPRSAKKLRAMRHSAESPVILFLSEIFDDEDRICAMPHSAESIFVEYLREFESICKTVLAHESGDPEVQFKEKKPRVENLVRLSL
jgi:hypothetical protein